MRVFPALYRFSSHTKIPSPQPESLNNIINNTASRLVNGGFWKKIEPPVMKTPLETFVESLQQFHNRCRANTKEFAQSSLKPVQVSCLEAYTKTVNHLQSGMNELTNIAERSALQFAFSKNAAAACRPVVVKGPCEDGTVKLTLTESRPLRKGVISVVRAMANIILPPRDTYADAATKYTCCTVHQ